MNFVSIILTLIIVIIVATLILKRYKPHAVLLIAGITLLIAAQFLGINTIVEIEKSTGFWLFDVFDLIRTTLTKDAGSLGMVIMAAGGYAVYMNHVGASTAMVNLCIKPLRHLGSPYIVLAISYVVGQIINIFVPSAAGLSVLLMATVYPILVSLGVSPISATAVIASAACLDLGPASGASNFAAEMSGIDATTYFMQYQIPVALVVVPVVALNHYFVQKAYDKRIGFVPEPQKLDNNEKKENVPSIYAILPIFPLILLLLFNDLVISSIKVNVVSAMIMGLFLTMIFECIRNRKNISNIFKSMQVFFDGMGKQFATIVTLIMAGEIFAEGLKHMGVIDMIIEGCKSIGFGAIPMTIIMVAIIIISSIVMGSGAAPFYAFIALAPSVAEAFGIQPVVMIMAMQLATGLGRNMSPIASCVVAACGGSGVSPVDVAKRTIIPMLLGTAALILADVIFFI